MEVLGNSSNIFSKMVVKELIEWFFLKEEGENIQTVGPHSLLQAHRDEAGEEGGLNDGGAVVAAKIIFIVMSENA